MNAPREWQAQLDAMVKANKMLVSTFHLASFLEKLEILSARYVHQDDVDDMVGRLNRFQVRPVLSIMKR